MRTKDPQIDTILYILSVLTTPETRNASFDTRALGSAFLPARVTLPLLQLVGRLTNDIFSERTKDDGQLCQPGHRSQLFDKKLILGCFLDLTQTHKPTNHFFYMVLPTVEGIGHERRHFTVVN